ncbi:unnamed protein product [Adineta steineri]|uniref:Uncharacterized protein n=2 Tax=Adineta steineri TaxID=433720 RepID=A0A816BJ75_9BILA|nr:unnamed protein product [Adineta steineri]CAF1610601.1 unnamed protein product [Adineta steineri]
MPRIRTHSSTPETRRRELLLLKSSSIDGRIKLAFDEAKVVVRNSIEYDNKHRLSYAEQFTQYDTFELYNSIECTTILPPIHRATIALLFNEVNDIENHPRISTTMEEFMREHKQLLSTSSIYHVELAASDDDDDDNNRENRLRFVTCFTLEPRYTFIDQGRRRRTSSLPSSPIIFDLSKSIKTDPRRSSSLVNLSLWQNNPQKIINLCNRQYHCQPISKLSQNKFLLSNSTHIDIYNIETGLCEEKLCFESKTINYIAMCYNQSKNELLVGSTTHLYIYNLKECKVTHEIHLPGFPFSLDYNKQIRYLACNSSSIYHGYFSYTSTYTSTVLSRLSQFELKHICDLEFDDGTMHGLHAFENYIGIVIRYGRYSSKQNEDYCLYIYDSLLDKEYYHIDLKDVGCITCLTGYERTLDWLLCDYKKQRLIFVNQESIEYVQYNENINQCLILNESNHLAVWLSNRILIYSIE